MKFFLFDLLSDEEIIIVNASIEHKYKFRLALDTAATHTTIDSNVLYLSGYDLSNSKGEYEIETANGIIIVERYDVEQLECLGIIKTNFEVQVYDITGKMVKTINNNATSGKNVIAIDVTNLEAGSYMYSINAGGTKMFSKFVVTK